MNKLHTFFKFSFVSLFAFLFTLGCSSESKNTADKSHSETALSEVSKNADEISVMVFNVENLFDTIHDVGTEDYANLPLAEKKNPEVQKFCSQMKNPYYQAECFNKDWNEEALKFKLSQLARVIRHTDSGKGPDVILMTEVENLNVLNFLTQGELRTLGYQTVILIEGPDLRGIDPALISKFPLSGKPQLHLIPYTDPDPEQLKYAQRSRGILEVTLNLPNRKQVTFLVGHFPSQSNPTAWRKQAVEFATKKMIEYSQQGRAVIMGGDLNIAALEEKDEGYFSKIFSSAGQVSHLVGCLSCEGTHNYKGEWSFLDAMIYGHRIDNAGLALIPESITVLKTAHHMKKNGTPLRFDEQKKEGVSDHYPLYSRLKIK